MSDHSGDTFERFDNSFIIHTIRDFFIGLLIIFLIELGARYALVLWNYETVQRQETQLAAESLAEDVRSIMLNRGGPVAARTVYPILQRDHQRFGLDIAIEPSEDTVKAVRRLMNSPPVGLPPDWREGVHHEVRVDIVAERFCIQCHGESKPGDTLGWVTVRNYRSGHISNWWADVRLSGLFATWNLIVDTMVLFFLLRLRMEPILSLRAVVSRLAKAGSDLHHRAPVRSGDEFGQLAHDLNLFLDRITHINDDLRRVLLQIDTLSSQMEEVSTAVDSQATKLAAEMPGVGVDSVALEALLEGLEAVAQQIGLEDSTLIRIAGMRAKWLKAREEATDMIVRTEIRALDGSAGNMRRLEERMRALAGEGQRLLARLGHEQENDEGKEVDEDKEKDADKG